MGRISIRLDQEGLIFAIRMTSRFLATFLHKIYVFLVDELLIDKEFTRSRDRFLERLDALRPEITVDAHHHEDHTGNNFWMTKKDGLRLFANPFVTEGQICKQNLINGFMRTKRG